MKIKSPVVFSPGACRSRRGFTLVELLVVVTILALLATLTVTMVGRMKRSGMTVKELAAARTLSAALMTATVDANGVIPLGEDASKASANIEETEFRGTRVTGEAAHRYPFRLAPYFGSKFDDVTVLDRSQKKWLKEKDTYMISLAPALGMNVYGVGGSWATGETAVFPGAIKRMAEAVAPEKMIAFASARMKNEQLGDRVIEGFHKLTPPLQPGGDWAAKYDENVPHSWGNVDLRNADAVVAGFLDGSAGKLGREQLRDMRYWNNEAARLDDPNHRPSSSSTGGGRGR